MAKPRRAAALDAEAEAVVQAITNQILKGLK